MVPVGLLNLIPDRAILTVREVADACLVRMETVRQSWIGRGVDVQGRLVKLSAFRAGAAWRIERVALLEFLRMCNAGVLEVTLPANGPDPADLQERVRQRLRAKSAQGTGPRTQVDASGEVSSV